IVVGPNRYWSEGNCSLKEMETVVSNLLCTVGKLQVGRNCSLKEMENSLPSSSMPVPTVPCRKGTAL
ncbi:hypothetical protein, partial [Fervidobacterium thailandense]|uniref:hypothetical protein n=1 Tax=Fervidobacterium thailandense TaxID=1008305 RepID=UPI0019D3B9F0